MKGLAPAFQLRLGLVDDTLRRLACGLAGVRVLGLEQLLELEDVMRESAFERIEAELAATSASASSSTSTGATARAARR